MHRNKHKAQAAKPPETREASEAVRTLVAQTLQRMGQEVEALSLMALRDAKLDPADGWRFNPQTCQYIRRAAG